MSCFTQLCCRAIKVKFVRCYTEKQYRVVSILRTFPMCHTLKWITLFSHRLWNSRTLMILILQVRWKEWMATPRGKWMCREWHSCWGALWGWSSHVGLLLSDGEVGTATHASPKDGDKPPWDLQERSGSLTVKTKQWSKSWRVLIHKL